LAVTVQQARAQSITPGVDLFLYGNNTEFANPFREGETILGAAGRVFVDVKINDTATIKGGFFGRGRFGSHEFLEEAEPLIALELARGPQRFIFGSLDTSSWRSQPRGPDEDTPHGLLPPLQEETLTFTRAHEMGLQWRVASPRVDHDVWINWQRLNTENHRERFDAGVRTRAPLAPFGDAVAVHAQWHVVHEGGQLFSNGPVRDSHALATGLEWAPRIRENRLVFDAYGVLTRQVPDRARLEDSQNGVGIFTRAALEHGPWRTHLIVWRSRDTLKEEGDPNYLMLRRDGTLFRKTRDYGELGLTRHFYPAPGVQFDAALRLHRTESHYEYSYRLLARIQLRR
jgi:hypothetical protein